EALPAEDLKALEELAHWLESVSVAEGFKPAERAALVCAVDEAAAPRLRKVAREYCGTARPSRYQENRMWTQLHEYWKQAGLALYPTGGETSPKQEFLKALLFSASSPDSLLAAEVELVERVIAELAPSFLLANAPAAGLLYWTDLGRAMAPQRIVKPPQASAGLRCFGPGNALAAVHAIIQRAEATRELPPSLGPASDPEAALDVLRHLAVLWSPEPPERKHARHMVKSRLTIAHGFAGVL